MKKFLTFILVLAMVMSVTGVAFATGGSISGTGAESDPFVIMDKDDLIAFRNSVNSGSTEYNGADKYVVLGANIDLAGEDWSINIGDDCSYTFDGIFDGKGYTIYNLTSTETAQKSDGYICTGLFGAIYGSAVVKNLTIENVTINTGSFTGNNVGAVVGFVYSGTGSIENVTVCGDIKINAKNVSGVGAVVGYAYNSSLTIKNCVVDGNNGSSVTGAAYVGGVIGYGSEDTTVSGCTVQDFSIDATSCCVGGVAGLLGNGSKASDNAIQNVAMTVAHENWQESAAIVVGTISGSVTISDTTYSNLTINGAEATDIAGSEWKNKPTSPVAAVQASVGDKYYVTLDAAVNAVNPGDTIILLTDDVNISDVNTSKDVTVVDSKGNIGVIKNGIKIYPANLDFGTKQAGYSGVAAQTVTVEGADAKPTITVNSNDYIIGAVQDDGTKYTFTVQPKDGLSAGDHDASITVTIGQAPSDDLEVGTIEAEFTVEPKPGNGISVTYNGGNSFSTSNPSVPTGVEIDGVPVTFNGTGSNFSVGCISSDAKWVTVRWNSTSVTTNFTPDGLVECTAVSIPKTGDMSIWAAIAQFLGF